MKTASANKKTPRIIVLGSEGFPKEVEAWPWSSLSLAKNISDYDILVIDLTTLDKDLLNQIAGKTGYLQKKYISKLLGTNRSIFVVGSQLVKTSYAGSSFTSLWWDPLGINLQSEEGIVKREIDPRFQRYFQEVDRWSFIILLPHNLHSQASFRHLALNNSGDLISVEIYFSNKGRLYFLPPPTKVSSQRGIEILLEDFCEIQIGRQAEPEWAAKIIIPGQQEIEGKIADTKERQTKIEEEINMLKSELGEITKCRSLLYSHDKELEEAVHEAFEELGATVIPRAEGRDDDGYIDTSCGYKGILEIKKSSKGATKRHVRQLDEWVGNALSSSYVRKGILVLNHYGDLPLNERRNPFDHNVIEFAMNARNEPFCLLTTLELFNALCAFREGRVKSEDILRKMFNAQGECKLI